MAFQSFDNFHIKIEQMKNYMRYSGIAFQMGGTIFAGAYLGKWLDATYPMDKKWFTMILTILAVVLSLYTTLRLINKINDEEDNKKNK
jgi:F0F1-type ATP synthase assembly protein I